MRRLGLLLVMLVLAIGLPRGPAQAAEGLVEFRLLAPDLAFRLARETLDACRERDFQVAVSVVDRFGVQQAMLRDRYAGPHTPDTSRRKAWTAVSFRTDTTELVANTRSGTPQAGARDITGALMLGGGVLVEAGGRMVGAVGVSGAPSGEDDDACARAGIEAIRAELPL
ncbi:MAG: heme-binding protein [Halofilum sp. (in: g-proteobacteria)]|nr:heme-binding protein [Halofilum sp. (in: g-proteobacteria)]